MPYLVLGLTSEAGEVAGKAKKLIRDGTESDLASEIGDVLWYCAMLATELNVSLGKLSYEERNVTILISYAFSNDRNSNQTPFIILYRGHLLL